MPGAGLRPGSGARLMGRVLNPGPRVGCRFRGPGLTGYRPGCGPGPRSGSRLEAGSGGLCGDLRVRVRVWSPESSCRLGVAGARS